MLKRLVLLCVPILLVGGLLQAFDVVDVVGLVTGEATTEGDDLDALYGEGAVIADDETAAATLAGVAMSERDRPGRRSTARGSDDTSAGAVLAPGSLPVKGRVLAPGGRSAKETRIIATGPAGTVRLTTDADGRFEGAMAPGRYKIFIDGGADGALLVRSFLIDGSRTEELEFTLRPTARFELAVQRGDEGVAGVNLRLSAVNMAESEGTVYESTTDARGVAVFETLPLSNYDIEGTIPEGPPFRQRMTVSSDRNYVIKVPGAVRFFGTIRSDSTQGPGVGGANVHIEIKARGGQAVFSLDVTAENDGTFDAMVPQGGLSKLVVTAEGYAPGPDTRNSDRTVRRAYYNARSRLWRGQETEYNLALTSGASIMGLVTDGDKTPMAGVQIQARSRYGYEEATTDDQGRYRFLNLNPSRYELRILTEQLFPEMPLRVNVPKNADKPVEFDFVLHAARTLRGVVKNGAGGPVVGARVFVTGGGNLLRSARNTSRSLETWTNASGEWLLNEVPSNIGVNVRASMGAEEALAVHIAADSTPPDTIALKLEETGNVAGILTDLKSGKPVANATIRIRPIGTPSGRSGTAARTNAKGEYKVGNLIPGTWSFQPELRGYQKTEPVEHKIGSGESAQKIDVQIDPGFTIEVSVLGSNGKPLQNARVDVSGQRDNGTYFRRRLNTTKEGLVRFTGLDELLYTVSVRANKHKRTTQQGIRTDNGIVRFQLQAR